MFIAYFRQPAVSRAILDAQIPEVPEEKGQPPYKKGYLKANVLMCTQVPPSHAVVVPAGSYVEILATVDDEHYRAHVIRYEEKPDDYVYCMVGQSTVGIV